MADKKQEMLDKLKERGYVVNVTNGVGNYFSSYNDRNRLNLEIWTETEEFQLNYMKGMILITTTKCGSFLNDKHFERIEREIRRIVFDLL